MNSDSKKCRNCKYFADSRVSSEELEDLAPCDYLSEINEDLNVHVEKDFGCIKFECENICRLCKHWGKFHERSKF